MTATAPGGLACACLIALLSSSGGCAHAPAEPAEAPQTPASRIVREEPAALTGALAYYQSLHQLPPTQLGRLRASLAQQPQTPPVQLRLALLMGHPRMQPELPRALALLDQLLKSADPLAAPLQPLARLLVDAYQERLKLDAAIERQAQSARDAQKRVTELQDKLERLTAVERDLKPRARPLRPPVAPGGKP